MKWNFLSLHRDHGDNVYAVDYFEAHYVVETGSQVLLNDVEIVALCQYLQQLVITEEVEARKGFALSFKVLLEALLYVV